MPFPIFQFRTKGLLSLGSHGFPDLHEFDGLRKFPELHGEIPPLKLQGLRQLLPQGHLLPPQGR
jgi:hypothetical protein